MKPLLGKPLFALLVMSGVASLLVLLQPAIVPTDMPTQTAENDLLANRHPLARPAGQVHDWHRPALPLPRTLTDAPAGPPPVKTSDRHEPVTEPLAPPHPSTPLHPVPDFRYLGRLERDGRVWVFLEQGENSQAIAMGELFEGQWKLDSLAGNHLEMTHVPSGASHSLPLEP